MFCGARSCRERALSPTACCVHTKCRLPVQPHFRNPSYRTTPHAAAAHSKVPDVLADAALQDQFDSIDDGIAAVARGEFVLVLDDQNRENEGDLIIAADKATPAQIAYMVEYTTGACLQITPHREILRFTASGHT